MTVGGLQPIPMRTLLDDAAKRQFAFAFGIDPYTDCDPVVNRLGEIARAAAGRSTKMPMRFC